MVKKTKRFLALALCASMVMGQSVVALAEPTTGGTVNTESPIYSFNVVDVLVPTAMDVALNPGGNTIKTGDSSTSTDQVVSRNFAVVNKSTKDKVITAKITITDLNDGENANKIKFVDSAAEVTSAKADEYAIYLAAVPSSTTAPQAGGAAIDKATTAAALADVTMTAVDAAAVPMQAGENTIEFKLTKATYKLSDGKDVVLGTTTSNDISESFEIDTVGGVSAFAFTGSMKDSAAWEKLTKGIKITTVYSVRDVAEDEAECVTGTNMLPAPSGPRAEVALSTAAGTAAVEELVPAEFVVKSVVLVSFVRNGAATNYNQTAIVGTHYTMKDGTFTLLPAMTSAWTACEFKITYEDPDGEAFVQTVTWAVEVPEVTD